MKGFIIGRILGKSGNKISTCAPIGTTSGRPQYRYATESPQYRSAKLLGLFLRGLCPRFPSETGKRLGGCANWHSVRPPPAPKAHREDLNVRKWQLDAYCPLTNCGGRVHRGVVLGSSKAPGATLGGLGGREPPERPFLPILFPRGKRMGAMNHPSIIQSERSRIGR